MSLNEDMFDAAAKASLRARRGVAEEDGATVAVGLSISRQYYAVARGLGGNVEMPMHAFTLDEPFDLSGAKVWWQGQSAFNELSGLFTAATR